MKDKTFIGILVISFLIVVGILGYFYLELNNKFEELELNQTKEDIFLNGTIYGSNLLIAQILSEAVKCSDEGVPLQFSDETYHLYLLECLEVVDG